MTTGEGIVVAALLIVCAWQIDKRGLWGAFGCISTLTVVVLVVLGLVAYIYENTDEWIAEYQSARTTRDDVRRVRAGKLAEFWGVSVGSDSNGVRSAKGQPVTVADWQGRPLYYAGTPVRWTYSSSHDGTKYEIYFDGADSKVVAVSCSGGAGCAPIAGVGIDADLDTVLSTFGPSMPVVLNAAQDANVYRYPREPPGSAGVEVAFEVRDDRVAKISVRRVFMRPSTTRAELDSFSSNPFSAR